MIEIRECPFCVGGEMNPSKGGYSYLQREPARGLKRVELEALECGKCGIIVFRRVVNDGKAEG